jgi:hypothetical protein
MIRYVYAFCFDHLDDEIYFRFAQFPDIISCVSVEAFQCMDHQDIQDHAADAVTTALQTHVAAKSEIPAGDDPHLVKADGFVQLSVQQAMKLELFKLYKENCRSILDFSKKIEKKETAARRLLNLRHQSWATEIESAIEAFGKRLAHKWALEVTPMQSLPRSIVGSPNP